MSADSGDTCVKFDYTYEPNSFNISTQKYDHRTNPADPCTTFSYDNLDRLVAAEYDIGDNNEVFTLDGLGNRESVNVRDGNTITYDVNELTNRYASVGGSALEYDAAGNLTKDRLGYGYSYDYENRIVEINDVNETVVAEFAYDALGRRIRKSDCVADTNTLYYYNDNWQVLCEYDGGGGFERLFMYGNYIDEPIMTYSGGVYSYVQDHLYSTAALVDAAGTPQERYEYDAYGQVHILDANFADDADGVSDCGNPYMFQGKRLDLLDNGGLELISWPYRDYSMYLGRWYQAEKLGMIPNDDEEINPFSPGRQYEDGLNAYGFGRSDPVANLDRYGLKVCCKTKWTHTGTLPSPGWPGWPGPILYTTSTECTQTTIPNPHGCFPEGACCHHYKDNPAVTVYGAYEHDEGCCWCDVYYVRQPGWIDHAWVRVVCQQGRGQWCAHVCPTTTPAGIGTCVIGESVTVDVLEDCLVSIFPAGTSAKLRGRVSCDEADAWKAARDGDSWIWNIIHNCWWFADQAAFELTNACP